MVQVATQRVPVELLQEVAVRRGVDALDGVDDLFLGQHASAPCCAAFHAARGAHRTGRTAGANG